MADRVASAACRPQMRAGLVGAAVMLCSTHVGAEGAGSCEGLSTPDTVRRACRMQRVSEADTEMNEQYARMRARLRPVEAQALLHDQRAWLHARDRECDLPRAAGDRGRWVADVSESATRAACVARATSERTAQLRRLEDAARSAPLLAEVAPPLDVPSIRRMPAALPGAQEGDSRRSAAARRSGRYYFEIVLDETRGVDGNTVVSARVVNGGQAWAADHRLEVRDLVIRPASGGSIRIAGGALGDARIPKIVLGWAADLDAGRAYFHRDGVWTGGVPPHLRTARRWMEPSIPMPR